MHLRVGSTNFVIAQIGPDFLIADEPIDLPPTRAELVVDVDGQIKRRTIFLPQGMRRADAETRIASV